MASSTTFLVNDLVRYTSPGGEVQEEGRVTSVNDSYVFLKGQACRREDLTLLTPDYARVVIKHEHGYVKGPKKDWTPTRIYAIKFPTVTHAHDYAKEHELTGEYTLERFW